MDPRTDRDIEELLMSARRATMPDRARFQKVLRESPPLGTRSPLSLSPLFAFMTMGNKVLVGLVAIVVIGGGVYLSTASRSGTTSGTDTSGTPISLSTGDGTVGGTFDAFSASVDEELASQSFAVSALDASANQVVFAVDTSNRSAQPYDESII